MVANSPPVTERDAEAALRQVLDALRLASEEMQAQLAEICALEETATESGLKKALTRFREAYHLVVKERQNFERDVYGRTGAFGAEPIDLDTARIEVGRLLDSLRAARASERVSGEPEP